MTDNERFEILAETFRQMTGFLAPGKSVPPAMASSDYEERRQAAWEEWRVAKFGECTYHAILAYEDVMAVHK